MKRTERASRLTSHRGGSPGSPRKRGPRHDLGLDDFLDAAEELLADQPAESLSLRAIATAVGVSPNAVYSYVDSAEDLTQELADRFLARLDLAVLEREGCPHCRALDFVQHVRSRLADQPNLGGLVAAHRIIGPGAMALNEALLGFFAEVVPAGLQSVAVDLLTTQVLGEALLGGGEGESSLLTRRLARLDPAAFPRTAAQESVDPLRSFEVIMDGLGLVHR